MSSRFSLRFVSGDRSGETHELEGPHMTLGRKPGNSLQLNDSSVSGTHAELLVDEGSVTLRDRNSTNGTKVAGAAIEEHQLAHGDEVSFGTVKAVFLDAELATEVEDEETDAVGSLSAAALEGGGSRSRFGFLVVILVAVVLGAGAWYGVSMFDSEGVGNIKPVLVVEGDLLDGSGSFEDDEKIWINDETASAEFLRTVVAATTGQSGMQAVLVAGERARMESETVASRAGARFEARASFTADIEAGARLGLLFSSGEGSLSSTAWSAVFEGEEDVHLEVVVPTGHDRVRLIVEARAKGDGSVSVDDASLVLAAGYTGEAAKVVGEYGFHLLGDPVQALCITKISTALVGGLGVEGSSLSGDLTKTGMELTASAKGSLTLDVNGVLVERGVASLGDGGFRVHGADFDREGVTSVLLGKGNTLVAVHMDTPCRVRARAAGEGMRLEAALEDATLRVQVDFADERKLAGDLAYEARGAEREGQLGDCLAAWAELLERYPYQDALVVEAEGVRGRLVQDGLLELQGVRAEVERASFFRLVELYRSCRDQANAVGARYAGSEVESEARGLVEAVELELGALEVNLDADEVTRLRSIHAVLLASESPRLAGEVASYLERVFNTTSTPEGE